jgi:hypothetical protein
MRDLPDALKESPLIVGVSYLDYSGEKPGDCLKINHR